MTITYTPYKDQVYLERAVNNFFINFYVKEFLPCLLHTRNIHTNAKKQVQPICYAFLDEHEMKPPLATLNSPTSGRANSLRQDRLIINHQWFLVQAAQRLL